MFVRILLGLGILLALAAAWYLAMYIAYRAGKLEEKGYDKRDYRADIVASREAVRRRAAAAKKRMDPRS